MQFKLKQLPTHYSKSCSVLPYTKITNDITCAQQQKMMKSKFFFELPCLFKYLVFTLETL